MLGSRNILVRAESLIALIVVMYDVTNWTILSVGDSNGFTPSKFKEEDEILHIGQMVVDLWQRVDRSLSRDAYSKLGVDGMERFSAIRKIVGIVARSSRLFLPGFS